MKKNYNKYVTNQDIMQENCGFPRPNKEREKTAYNLYMKWKDKNEHKISKQRTRYQKLLMYGSDNLKKNNKLKRMMRKGVPPEYRGEIWYVVSGAKDMQRKNPKIYPDLVVKAKRALRKKDQKKMEHIQYIQRDIDRTFPELKFFQDKENLVRLRDILFAYSIYKPEIGYCQGLNFLAGIFLYFMNSEEKAFWTLDACLSNYLPHDLYDPTLNGVYCESFVLSRLVRDRNKKVEKQLKRLDFKPEEYAIFATSWFMCLYLNNLPIEASLRVMDAFIFEGNKVLFRIGITILSLAEEKFSKMTQKGEVIQFLKDHCANLYDHRNLMKKCFAIRNFSKKKLVEYRNEFRARNKKM